MCRSRNLTSLLGTLAMAIVATALAGGTTDASDADAHRQAIETWRAERLARLRSESGWLTLVGLHELNEGRTSFGRDRSNGFALDHASLPPRAGVFEMREGKVSFTAQPGSNITHEGQPVAAIAMQPDSSGTPTVLAAGSLRFFVLDRGPKRYYVRVRDTEHPLRTGFRGLNHFPIDPAWKLEVRFESYDPPRTITITDVLGQGRDMPAPGALVFERSGREWRLDAVLEEPDAKELFVMFADGTSGRETYGGGRYLYVPLPVDGKVALDFNKAYNPPCVFSDFATCPLPPWQNRLTLRVEAGERRYERPGH